MINMTPATDWVWDSYLNRFAVSLDGTAKRITFPGTDANKPTVECTLSIWVNFIALTTSLRFLMINRTGDSEASGPTLFWNASKAQFWANNVSNTTWETQLTADANAVAGIWYHVAGTYAPGSQILYINGVAQADTEADTNNLVYVADRSWHLGAQTTGAGGPNALISDPLIFSRALSPSEIQRYADPSNVMLSGLILPPRRKLWGVPSGGAGTTINATLGTVSITGLNALISVGTNIAATTANVAIEGLNPTVSAGVQINATLGTVAVSGLVAQVSIGTTINATVGEVAIAGIDPDVSTSLTIAATLGTVAITGHAATISAGTTIDATLGEIAITGQAATVDTGVTISATLGEVTVTGLGVSISVGTTIDSTTGGVTVAGQTATVDTGITISATLGTVDIAGFAATIDAGTAVFVSLAEIAITSYIASISVSADETSTGSGVPYKRIHSALRRRREQSRRP